MFRHKKSLKYAQKAVEVLTHSSEGWREDSKYAIVDILIEMENYSFLAIAYYNMGSQYEFLKKFSDWKEVFQKAIQVLKNYGNKDHPLLKEIKNWIRKVDKKIKRGKTTK